MIICAWFQQTRHCDGGSRQILRDIIHDTLASTSIFMKITTNYILYLHDNSIKKAVTYLLPRFPVSQTAIHAASVAVFFHQSPRTEQVHCPHSLHGGCLPHSTWPTKTFTYTHSPVCVLAFVCPFFRFLAMVVVLEVIEL